MRNNQPVTQKEVLYGDEESLISTTDLESRITYANEAFCKVAGFTEKELQGQHHNMVRHPDMPKQAFADLWEHIKAGKSWMGLVKNRCQNGDHYWVSAFVTPIRDSNGKVIEYQSVRSAPRSEWKSRAEKVYEGLRAGKMPNLMCLSCSAIGLGGAGVGLLVLLGAIVVGGLPWAWGIPLLVLQGAVAGLLLRSRQRLAKVNALAREYFDNPLMEHLYTGQRDDLSAVELALIMGKAELRAVVARSQQTCINILRSAEQDQRNIEVIASNQVRQQEETNMVATAMEEMNASIHEVAKSASASSKMIEDTQSLFADGHRNLSETVNEVATLDSELQRSQGVIHSLAEQCRAIDTIVLAISEIANQTNLLALNAAIEAARAGDQGRGFAVVADEVRQLATRTQSSTGEIQSIIHRLQSSASEAEHAMQAGSALSSGCQSKARASGELLEQINAMLLQVAASSTQIAQAVDEQSQVTTDMNDRIHTIKDLADNSRERSTDAAHGIDQLVGQLGDLERLVRQFIRGKGRQSA
ncbi:methyl-accepting chemotaxis protein [Aeromonas schubertii]|uniref:methyl-accepting chemotaxis protein n=1 Tax=Aeromonas schubertii TaxID=652 RepID=UPI00067F0C99|nr:PAS domain-containing methyl-accepting chemotaxis protein [Aeromonas schubertii]KUE81424.1 chemotaxis protein [Aeromonas schubertii]QCG48403.1 PAS domain S-box protein [Aeromonas schubertii]